MGNTYVDAAGVSSALSHISSQVAGLAALTSTVAGSVNVVDKKVDAANVRIAEVEGNLNEVYKFLKVMRKEQAMAAALQKALTEIIRVRQELEHDFGNYKIVRDSMLGILQATDKALVTENTISRISEELMLTTPKYWLAPCLVAVSAWIGNNEGLAQRAIAEAVRRDEEKTALVMALICRRNGRQQACFAWLQIYFSKLDALHMTRSVITYIDAYISGIFGPDKNNVCNDYISKWMHDLQGQGSRFHDDQVTLWRNYFETFRISGETQRQYPELAAISSNFPVIDDGIQAVVAAPKIQTEMDGIMRAPIDEEALRAKIDQQLTTLVSSYDAEETPLREEEEYLQLIKDYKGDEAKAKQHMQLIKDRREDKPVDFGKRLAAAAQTTGNENIAAKKTAIYFLKEYIIEGYKQFLAARRASFPEQINLKFNTWNGKYQASDRPAAVLTSFEGKMNNDRNEELNRKKFTSPIIMMVLAVVAAIIGFVTSDALQVIMLIGAAILLAVAIGKFVSVNKARKAINEKYDDYIMKGKKSLGRAMEQWNAVEDRFNCGMTDNKNLTITTAKEN